MSLGGDGRQRLMGLSCAQIMRDKPPTGRRVVCHDGAIVHDLEGIVRQLRVCGDGLADGCQLNLARREVKLESICAPPDSDRHDDVLWSTRFSFLPTPMSDNKRTANSLTGLRAHQPAATPIPPSLQAKMAAFAQRAASNNPNNNIGPNSHPVLHPASSFPPPPPRPSKPAGMAARRARPNFTLRDIESVVLPDGPVAAGLGAGRPSLFQQETPRRPQAGNFGTPFANFSKIVYASHCFFHRFLLLTANFQRSFRCTQFQRKSHPARCRRQLFKRCLLLHQHGPAAARRGARKGQLRHRQKSSPQAHQCRNGHEGR